MAIMVFIDDDSEYLDWIAAHPDGYVVNSRRKFDSGYLVLHRAKCPTVHSHRGMMESPGGFTERSYLKFCSESMIELGEFLQGLTGLKDPYLKDCSRCGPR